MKNLMIILLLVSPFLGLSQNNLLDTSTWATGSGSTPGFNDYGPTISNVRETDIGPHGTVQLIWKSPANSTSNNDGGWETDYFNIDPSKTYRFTVWVKRLNSLEGTSQFGINTIDSNDNQATLKLNDTQNNNPYFESNPPPMVNDWYLFVGFVYGHAHTTGENGLEGVYDMSGNRVITVYNSYKFATTAVKVRHRNYFRLAEPSAEQWFYAPTVYEVNGQEPTIQELINGPNNTADTQPPTAPLLSSSSQTDTTVDLSWSGATDNVGVTGYTVFQDNVQIQTNITTTSYQVTGLAPSTAYDFKVKAYDAAGNQSADSNVLAITTDADPGSGGGTSGTSVWTESNTTASYSGEVAVGRSTVPSGYKLAVEGNVRAREIRVDTESWPDYVFSKGYDLPSLEEIQKHIEEKGHLPNIPSAREVEAHGIELGEMNRLLLEKIEELTLYIIELKKENEKQNLKIQRLMESKE